MAQTVTMTKRLLLVYILSWLSCTQARISRGPFGLGQNSPSIISKVSKSRSQLLQIRGGGPSTKVTAGTNDDGGDDTKKADVSAEPAVETPANNVTADAKEEVTVNAFSAEIEESSDLDTDDELAEAIEMESDQDEEDFYTDSEDSDSEEDALKSDDVEENQNLELVVETVVKVSQKAGVLALKFSKVAAFWVRQWSWDIYRACERAVDACREELAEGVEDLKLTKAETKDATKLQLLRMKSWKITKRTCTTAVKMTVAFWKMDDNDILPPDEPDEEVETFKPKFSFLDKFKLRSDVEEEETEDETVEDTIEPVKEEEVKESSTSKTSSKTRHKKRKSKRVKKTKKAVPALKTTPAPKVEQKTVVTVIPKIQNRRRMIIGLAVGVACGFLWEQVGVTALILNAIPPQWKSGKQKASLETSEESQ